MLDIVIAFIVTATLTSAIWIYLVWKPNDNNSMGEKEDKTTEIGRAHV